MDNEIIKAGIFNPQIIPDILEAEVLESNNHKKLKELYSQYLKNKKMPSQVLIEKWFKLDLSEENQTDTSLVYGHITALNAERFCNDLTHRVWSGEDVSQSVIAALQKEYIKDYSSKEESRFRISSVSDLIDLKKQIDHKEESYITTGFTAINDLTRGDNKELPGGWRPSSLYTIMGLSGYGKSIFLSNFARDSWAKGNNILYISTEMNHVQTFDRILKSYYEVTNFNEIILKKDKVPFPSGEIEVVKVHPNDTTYIDIQSIIDQLDWRPDILFIDYADELKSHERSNSEYEAQGVIYAGLKKLAEENNFPVITATQTNREAEDSNKGGTKDWVGMGAVADSTKKVRLVDMLFSITQSTDEKKRNVLNLIVLKNRFGKSNIKISFQIDYEKMLLTEMDSMDVLMSEQNIKRDKPVNREPPKPVSTQKKEAIQSALDKYKTRKK